MFKKKTISIYYCDVCGTEYGLYKPTEGCKHEVCGKCIYYDDNGFCKSALSTDTCADRDSDRLCDNSEFIKKDV